ncbi:hypothetical protein ACFOW3_23530 [Acidovorax facilis]|uniref:Uncharacterized protein n=1 Tax=Acidovorax facilis TaxID=12917 RepID=A0ABV8DGE8_9BURK|nr:hypothetical protein [Acidovorax facilis]
MTTLAQTYVHFKTDASPEKLDVARKYFLYVAALSASEHFKNEVLIDLRVEEGSLKGWITVAGALYAGICAYGSFREGIDYLVKDGKEFSDFVIKRTLSDAAPPAGALVRAERRLGVPGQISRLLPLVEKAEAEFQAGNAVAGREHLAQARVQLDRIEKELLLAGETDALNQLKTNIPSVLLAPQPGPVPTTPVQTLYVPAVLLDNRRRDQSNLSPQKILSMFDTPPKPPHLG